MESRQHPRVQVRCGLPGDGAAKDPFCKSPIAPEVRQIEAHIEAEGSLVNYEPGTSGKGGRNTKQCERAGCRQGLEVKQQEDSRRLCKAGGNVNGEGPGRAKFGETHSSYAFPQADKDDSSGGGGNGAKNTPEIQPSSEAGNATATMIRANMAAMST